MRRALGVVAGLVLAAAILPAQTGDEGTFNTLVMKAPTVTVVQSSAPFPMRLMAPQVATYQFIGAQAGFDASVVKNAPYSAEGVTEAVRVLGDGTRITQKTSSKVYRDSEGRVRREQTLGTIGPWAPAGEEVRTMVTIEDPVAQTSYILDPGEKTVRRMRRITSANFGATEPAIEPPLRLPAGPGGADASRSGRVAFEAQRVEITRGTAIEGQGINVTTTAAVPAQVGAETKEENLGERTVEGVSARGTRVTTTTPAGAIGNDRPITITRETWYSPELQTIVLSEIKDPLSGDRTYRLTNVRRTDPPRSLFEVPADYSEAGTGVVIQQRIEVKPKQ